MAYIPGASKPPVPLPEVAMAQQAEVAREFARHRGAREAREAAREHGPRPWWGRLFRGGKKSG